MKPYIVFLFDMTRPVPRVWYYQHLPLDKPKMEGRTDIWVRGKYGAQCVNVLHRMDSGIPERKRSEAKKAA